MDGGILFCILVHAMCSELDLVPETEIRTAKHLFGSVEMRFSSYLQNYSYYYVANWFNSDACSLWSMVTLCSL